MTLLSLKEIQQKILELYELSGREVPELNMAYSNLDAGDLSTTAMDLGVVLPDSFVDVTISYEFGNLDVGGVFFGTSGSYVDFLKSYNGLFTPQCWWVSGERPESVLMVAATDSYVILMECQEGKIFAFLRGSDWDMRSLIATSFEQLVQGAGTIYFGRKKAEDKSVFGREVGCSCGAGGESVFWTELAQGFA